MPLPLTVSCFSKIQIGFTFLVSAYPGSPRQRAIKRVCVCVYRSKYHWPFLIPQLGVVVMVEGGILLKQSLLVDIRQSDCCIASVIPNLWSPFWLQSCALESVLIFCPTEDVRLSWMGGWSSSTDRLVEVKLWLVCNGCADKVKWTTEQSWNLRENGWGFGSTGSEVDGFHVFSGKFVYMTYKQTSMLWKKKKDNVFGEFMEELSLWDMAEKKCILLKITVELCRKHICFSAVLSRHYSFSALILLVGCQEEHLACKNWLMWRLCGYLSGVRCIWICICIWFSWCHCHFRTSSSLPSFESRLVLPFSYQLTQVVLEKKLLNGCSSSYPDVIL